MNRKYSECRYAAFISYAHYDDSGNGDWISALRKELKKFLDPKLARVEGGQKPLHLSQENGPIAGVLSEELRERIRDSFAMILVVGENYVESEWCLTELEYFKELFGAEGFLERLYILALSRGAITALEQNPRWKNLLGPNQIWKQCFDDETDARPINPYRDGAGLSTSFRDLLYRLTEDFVPKIKDSATSRVAAPASDVELVRDCIASPAAHGAILVPASPVRVLGPAAIVTVLEPSAMVAETEPAGAVTAPHPPTTEAKRVRIYIESNPAELNEWQPLGERIAQVWNEISAAHHVNPPINIHCRALPVDRIDPRKHEVLDADGVVLLWGKKDGAALFKNIDKVEGILPPGNAIAPGIIACLTPPQSAEKAREAYGWSVVRFQNRDSEMEEASEEAELLKAFLLKVLRKHQPPVARVH